MSILINGMEMPTRCCECRLSTCHSFKERPLCDVLVEYMSYGEWEAKRLDNCPLVPIPPHGRLIDADALKVSMAKGFQGTLQEKLKYIFMAVDDAPTVIPA